MMQYNSLVYYALSFVAVVKAGGFSSAAKKNNVSKAQLSRHVKTLETLLNIQLLQRSSRTMILTEQGQQFYNAFLNIEENCIEAIHQLKQDFSGMQGILKVTAPIDFGIQFLPPILHQFSKQYPNINVTLALSNINENITELQYDLAIRVANKLPDSNLRMRTMMEFTRIICASPQYFKDHQIPMHPDELKHHHLITSVNHNTHNIKPQWQFNIDDKELNYTLDNYIEVDSLYAQLELIKLGAGIGRMPNYFVQNEINSGELIELFLDIEKPKSYIYLLYPDIPLPQRTRVFIDFIRDTLNRNKKNTPLTRGMIDKY
jgi:DNA-binding transcriptional LysR family regulator